LRQTIRGRDDELAVIGEQLQATRSGSGAVVLVEGTPGVGKTRLFEEADAMGRRLGFRVGTGSAEPATSAVDMGSLLQAVAGGPDPLIARSAIRELPSAPGQRFWLLQDLTLLLEQAALEAPLLICLDDAQWADNGTVSALTALPAQLAELPIVWMVAYRPPASANGFADTCATLRRRGAATLALRPVSADAVRRLAIDVFGAEPGDELLAMAARCGGHPYLLMELLLGLEQEGLVRVSDNRAELAEVRLPRRFGDSMSSRLEGLSEPAREAVVAAASLGRRFTPAALAAMLGTAVPQLILPARELIAAGLMAEEGDRLRFWHDITRDAVRESVPRSLRRALDRHAVDVLLGAGAPPVEVAAQLAASAEPGDEHAMATLFRAAETLGRSDASAAADLGRRALEIAPVGHASRGAMVARTAALLHAAGRTAEAREFAESALRDTLSPEEEAEVRLSIAGMLSLPSDVRVAHNHDALELRGLPSGLRGEHLVSLVHNLWFAGRAREAREVLLDARRAVESHPDANAAFRLEVAEAGLAVQAADYRAAAAMLQVALRRDLRAVEPIRIAFARLLRAGNYAFIDDIDAAWRATDDGIATAERDRQAWALNAFLALRGRLLLRVGRLDDAATALRGRLDAGEPAMGQIDAAALVAIGTVALRTGDAKTIRETADLAREILRSETTAIHDEATWLLALQAKARGDDTQALDRLREVCDAERGPRLPVLPLDVTNEAQMMRIALSGNDRDLAEAIAAGICERADRNPGVSSIAGSFAHARGLLERSQEQLEQAVELFAGGWCPLGAASAFEDLGVLLGTGRRTAMIAALDDALALYVAAGASWDARRVRRRLRAVGIRRRLGPMESTSGWDAVTEAELAVVKLVTEGLTNRRVAEQLYLSTHTVNTHVRNVFTKLGVNSRLELIRLYDARIA
jgi:DNA-binding CsgD family transcriptional regulator